VKRMDKVKRLFSCMMTWLLIAGFIFPTASRLTIAAAKHTEAPSVLLIYDSLGNGSSKAGNVEALQHLLTAYGAGVTTVALDSYKPGAMFQYQKVIGIRNAYDALSVNPDYERDFEAYNGDYMHIGEHVPAALRTRMSMQLGMAAQTTFELSIASLSQGMIRVDRLPYVEMATGTAYGRILSASGEFQSPFGIMKDGFAYVPYFEQGNLSELAMAYILKDFVAPQGTGEMFVVLKEIYPFSDLQLLERLADKLYAAGIPFVASVRPVFSNVDYPAMKRYLETLKYVQSRNGSIVVNAPVTASAIPIDDRTLTGKMESFIDVLADYGVAPLGLGAGTYWADDARYAEEAMGFFDSVVLFSDVQPLYREKSDTSIAFASALYDVRQTFLQQFDTGGKSFPALPLDTALIYDLPASGDEADALVQKLASSWMTFADYKSDAHTVRTGKYTVRSDKGILRINDRVITNNDAQKDIRNDYVYRQEDKKSFAAFFNMQNNFFIVAILATFVLFGYLLRRGYRLYKQKYFK